jgi:hypothetical protein
MLQKFVTILLLFFLHNLSPVQAQSDTLYLKRVGIGLGYYQNTWRISIDHAVELSSPNLRVYRQMQAAQYTYYTAIYSSFLSGGALFYAGVWYVNFDREIDFVSLSIAGISFFVAFYSWRLFHIRSHKAVKSFNQWRTEEYNRRNLLGTTLQLAPGKLVLTF